MSIKQKMTGGLLDLPRPAKQMIVMLSDISLCTICVVAAFYLRFEQFIALKGVVITGAWVAVALAIPIFWLSGLYHSIFRYSGSSIFFSVAIASVIYGLVYFCVFGLYRVEGVPRSIGIVQPMLLFFAIVGSRLFVRFILGTSVSKKTKHKGTFVNNDSSGITYIGAKPPVTIPVENPNFSSPALQNDTYVNYSDGSSVPGWTFSNANLANNLSKKKRARTNNEIKAEKNEK
jgi:hypothetical protein